MMDEKILIDVKPLKQNGWHLVRTGEGNRFLASMSLADVPTVDAAEVVHGRWIRKRIGKYSADKVCCSICGSFIGVVCSDTGFEEAVKGMNYCPNCGAKMDGDE